MSNNLWIIIFVAIAVCAAFVIALIVMRSKKKAAVIVEEESEAKPGEGKWIGKVIMSCDAGEVHAPVPGKVRHYSEIPDETFASGAIGQGVGIDPDSEDLYAPVDGTITTLAESLQAIGISGPGEMELLLHVGVDTIAMNGDGFTPYVKEGDVVMAGQPLMHFDRKKIAAAGYPDMVVVLMTNSSDMKNFELRLD